MTAIPTTRPARRRLASAAGLAILSSTACSPAWGDASPARTAHRARPTMMAAVSVGGTAGIQALANPANTARLRATGRVGLYLHEKGTEILASDRLGAAVAKAFAGSGPNMAELGISATRQDAINFFTGPYQVLYRDPGFRPVTANVNGLDPTGKTGSLAQWQDFAAVAAQNGIVRVVPFVNNNNPAWPNDFDDRFWDYTRTVARAMGGCALDTPPGFAFESGRTYLRNLVQVVQWCRANHLLTSIVISPHGDQSRFLSMTRRFYRYVKEHDALPNGWVVENFDDAGKPLNPRNVIAGETAPDSTTGVALWMAENAGVAPPA
ncbi:MAG: hypothetical protein INR65_14640 [Gluconacetobacter diazotrophicus]|nr:hypothetical protein [Gluconacetobacter diazotrophicus]